MRRMLYGFLIRWHPRRFRERFGDEMLSIFDQAPAGENVLLFTDGIVSLLRQRIVRSNLWKMACGAAISAFVICVWAGAIRYAMEPSLELIMKQSMKLQWAPPSAESRIDMDEFRRETASAVAMLAEMKKKDEQSRRAQPRAARKTQSNPGPT
jgi:hypothetical protein